MTARSFTPNTFATLACVAVGALVLVGKAAAVADAGSKVRLSTTPGRAVQGGQASVTVAVPRGARCTLTVRYGSGETQPAFAPARAPHGRIRWVWRVPETAATGPAKLVVDCGSAGRAVGALAVVAGPKANDIEVAKRGFSQRIRYGRTSVSWGLELKNTSPDRDALDVVVVVNFVDATNTVLGTDIAKIAGIRAGKEFFLGGGEGVPSTAIVRLEVVVRVGSRAPRVVHEPPVDDVRILPAVDGFVGSAVGQVANDREGQLLRRSRISAVFFDAAGNISGGSTGIASAPLPAGARSYFRAGLHASAVPMTRAATVRISVEPTFQAVG